MICSPMMIILKYVFGFATGFVYSTFSKSPKGIAYNLITAILYILFSENLRNIVLDKGKYYKSVVFLTPISFSILEYVSSETKPNL